MILLGSGSGYTFEGPHTLATWVPPATAGVVVVLRRQDGSMVAARAPSMAGAVTEATLDYRIPPGTDAVIFVGHSDNLAAEGFPFSHPDAGCWAEQAGSRDSLLVAYFVVPGRTLGIRRGITHELCSIYRPPCGSVGPDDLDEPWGDRPPGWSPPGGVREPRRPTPSPRSGVAMAEED